MIRTRVSRVTWSVVGPPEVTGKPETRQTSAECHFPVLWHHCAKLKKVWQPRHSLYPSKHTWVLVLPGDVYLVDGERLIKGSEVLKKILDPGRWPETAGGPERSAGHCGAAAAPVTEFHMHRPVGGAKGHKTAVNTQETMQLVHLRLQKRFDTFSSQSKFPKQPSGINSIVCIYFVAFQY